VLTVIMESVWADCLGLEWTELVANSGKATCRAEVGRNN
jgi:hypothetical protein